MTNQLPDWLQELQQPLPGETPGDHIARCVKAFNGVSLINEKEKLFALFSVNELTPERAAQVAAMPTDCASAQRCVMTLCGSPLPEFTTPYKVGSAISILIEAGMKAQALINCHQNPNAWKDIQTGDIMMYASSLQSNDWHAESALGTPDDTGMGDHGGFGRANNGCTVEHGHMTSSLGRPIQYIIKCDKLGIPAGSPLPTPEPSPAPTPDPGPTPDPTPQPSPNPIQPVQPNTSLIDTVIAFIVKLVGWFLSLRK